MNRRSGILTAISSLPSPYGIGTLGKAAYDYADFLARAGQKIWQILPLGPTGCGDSPYSCFSCRAGNPYLIDLDMLTEDGLLEPGEAAAFFWGENPRYVDYAALAENRLSILARAKERGFARDRESYEAFAAENAGWLPDYALFMAARQHFGQKPWTDWPEALRLRRPEALEEYRALLQPEIELYGYIQLLFYRQWDALRSYVHKKNIAILGDIPIYMPLDSADVWAEPGFFALDEKNLPCRVAGVPPDYFCEDGQLWGNPLYDWEAMKKDGYGWWIRRVDGASRLYDILRIDHFRGLAAYWAVPAEAATAKEGVWEDGPGMELVTVLKNWFPAISYIAEDLGAPAPEVTKLLADSGWPGMKVLEFAFDPKDPGPYLPHNHIPNCVVYTGTHDNLPLKEWLEDAGPETLAYIRRYLNLREGEDIAAALLRTGMASVADTFIAQIQDWLRLGKGHGMNRPGVPLGNWRWRLLPGEASEKLADEIRALAELYGRCESGKRKDEIK